MLKLIKVPDESTFTESDLKPDLKVTHKDGRQFTLNKHGSSYWTLTHQGLAYAWKCDDMTLMFPREIIPLLNRDFRRAEEHPQYKTVGEVPDKVVFDYEHCKLVFPTNYTTEGLRRCVGLETGSSLTIPIESPVTRVHGPITIDPSVTEGV